MAVSISIALDPNGNPVPIEEADHRINYYRCPRCHEFVNPRMGSDRSHYFAHAPGVQDDSPCPLGAKQNYDKLVDEYRTSEVEKSERDRRLRLYLRQVHGNWLELFGVLPALDRDDISDYDFLDETLSNLEISSTGLSSEPSPQQFHPSEPEVEVELDPSADEYKLCVKGPEGFESITGIWQSDPVEVDDLFIGDQKRAKKHTSDRRINDGEWVYVVTESIPSPLPDAAETFNLDSFDVIGFPVIDETSDLFETLVDSSRQDQYGFEANIMLPRWANPTSDEPVIGQPDQEALIGVQPAEEIDPVFEIVSVPKSAEPVRQLEQTGPGNPRFYITEFPKDGSQKISIHQQRSERHRFVHLFSSDEPHQQQMIGETEQEITCGVKLTYGDEDELLTPIEGPSNQTLRRDLLTSAPISLLGPDGMEVEVRTTFPENSNLGPTITRTTTVGDGVPEQMDWIQSECKSINIVFDRLGTVTVAFDRGDGE